MFGNIIRKSSTTLAKFFNQPALAVAGGKTINNLPASKNFIDYAQSGGSKETGGATFEKEMKTTNKIADKEEQQQRRHDPQSGATNAAFQEPAKGSAQSNFGKMDVPDERQHKKFTEKINQDESRFYKGKKDPAEKQGEILRKVKEGAEQRKL